MSATIDPPATSASRRTRRTLLPRFGLRTLLVFAILFCLLFGWIGRNAYRIRQQDAAIEALKRGHATIYTGRGDVRVNHPATPRLFDPPNEESPPSFPMRLLGLAEPAEVTFVTMHDDLPKDEALDDALAALARFPTLEKIEFSGTAFTNESLRALAPLPNLQELSIFSSKISGEAIARLPSRGRIRRLQLSQVNSGLAEVFKSMPDLRVVQMYRMPVSHADLEALAALTHLESLNLASVQPEADDVYAPLAKAQNLKRLFFMGSSQGDADMKTLAKLTRLERLEISGITDAGAADLAPLTNLRWIEFKKPVTLAAAQEFSATHPLCVVMAWTPKGKQQCYLNGEAIDRKTAYDVYASYETIEE